MKPTAVKAVRGKPTKAVKTASRSMRGVKQGAKSIKIAQTVAKRTRQAAKASVQAIRRAQQVARAAVHTIRAAAHAIAAAAKATVAAVKGLAAAIAAGGWVVLLIILIVCLAAMLFGSVFGAGSDQNLTGCHHGNPGKSFSPGGTTGVNPEHLFGGAQVDLYHHAIEGFNRQPRKVTKAKSVFPTDDSLLKMLYPAMMDITKKWTGRRQDWSLIHAQMTIYFAGRMSE